MNSYEKEIELISIKMDKLEDKIQDESIDITFNRRKQIDKWTYECLEKYIYFLIQLNNSSINNIDIIIQTFHNCMDGCLNLTNFHSYLKKNENQLRNLIISYPVLESTFSDFVAQVKKEPPNTKIMYKEIYDPIDLQKFIKKEIDKLATNERIRKDYLDLFCNEKYYNSVDIFFKNMYSYCNNSKQYRIPKYYYEDFVDTFINNIDDEDDFCDDEKKSRKIKETLTTNNKLTFLEILFTFLLYPTEYLLNYLYGEITYPILEECNIVSKWNQEMFYGEHKYTDKTKNKDVYENKYGFNKLIKSRSPSDRGYRYSEKTIDFFVEKNNCTFFKETNFFINLNNKFFLGKIIRSEKCNKNIPEEQLKNLEETSKAVLDYYHMQEIYYSINSIFNFQRTERSYLTKSLDSKMNLIKEKLKEKYKNTDYSDIPDLFVQLIKKQKFFFKTNNCQKIENLDDDYFNMFENVINREEKYKTLSKKFNPEGLNTALKNLETIVYNTAARVSDPHFPEKQKEDYYKQLTIFFPEVYDNI